MVGILSCLCLVSLSIFSLISAKENGFYKKELFSTKTPYFWSSRNMTATIPTNEKAEIVKGNNTCTVVCVDAVLRHGSRYPSLKWIRRFSEIKGKLNDTGTTFIDNWTNRFPESQEEQLSSIGQDEMYYIGKRFATRFHSLLEQNMDRMKSFSSKSQRAIDSATYFSNGLARVLSVNSSLANVENQTLIRFYDSCDKYIKSVEDNDTALLEYDMFKEGPEIAAILKNVSNRVSSGKFNLTIGKFLQSL